ncbi:hypothetical protein [Streptomyces nigrescens]|uniref:hypothetical protein n=1 Tax=Streptomyces nigrescens TaxID=1920 RepID=UPI0036FE8066
MPLPLPQLPLAQEIEKKPYSPHEFHNRVRKALLITAEIRRWHFGGEMTARGINALTRNQMAIAAGRIDVRPPRVTAEGSPTEDLIVKFLQAILQTQPSRRIKHLPKTMAELEDELHQAIAIAFKAFWDDFDGHPTPELINELTSRKMTAIARRVSPVGCAFTPINQRTQTLVHLLLHAIHDAQPTVAPAPVQVTTRYDETTLAEALTAAVTAAKTSNAPTIVVLHLPQ